jgi:hypothetical protein
MVMMFIFSIYLISTRNAAAARSKSPSSPSPIVSSLTDFEYEGFRTDNDAGPAELVTAHLKLSSGDHAFFSLHCYKGLWKSDDSDFSFYRLQRVDQENNATVFYQLELASDNRTANPEIGITAEKKLAEIRGWVNRTEYITFKLVTADKNKALVSHIVYAIFISAMYLVTILALAKHFQMCYENHTFAENTALQTLTMMEIYELAFGLWEMRKAFEEKTSAGIDYVLISSFWSFSAFMFIHSKLLTLVFRAQNAQLSAFGFYMSSRVISNFQSRTFLFAVAGIVMLKVLGEYSSLTLPLLHLIFLPQIVKSSINGHKTSFSMLCLSGYLLPKLAIALYFLGCPANFIRYQPNYSLLANIVLILLLQIAVLYWQQYKPRFLVPRRYRPMYYEYFRSESEEKSIAVNSENTCLICMTPLNVKVKHSEPVVNNAKTMHTPCNHRFHQDCLLHWMQIKMDCPICRAKMPVFEE